MSDAVNEPLATVTSSGDPCITPPALSLARRYYLFAATVFAAVTSRRSGEFALLADCAADLSIVGERRQR